VAGAILGGDDVTGTTLMLITAKMDAGPILAQQQVGIGLDETRGELEERLALRSADLLVRRLPDWVRGRLTPVPQDEQRATYTRRVTKEDGLINWSAPARRIALQVRAYNPWPVAFTAFRGRQLRVLRAMTLPGAAEPGVVLSPSGNDIAVGTGDGLLGLHQVQLAGGRPMDGRDLLLGYRDIIGGRLG
jgi:methionyl-tRNA formyltransferase